VLEIVTAILLGLVSVATAIGAYQAGQWNQQAGELASASQQLRDRNLALFLQSQNLARDDGEKMFDALALTSEMTFYPERTEQLQAEQDLVLAQASPQLATAWQAWEDSGFDLQLVPLYSPAYEAMTFAPAQSHNLVSALADRSAKSLDERGHTMTIVSVVFAVALLLLGVAGASSSLRVSALTTGGGALAFLAGVAIVIFGIF
jgi:hypothetical protein